MVGQLEAVHRISPLAYWGEPFDSALNRADAQKLFDDSLDVPPVIHPVVRVHPTTGRPNLFVNPGFTSHIVGMSRIESDGLLHLLYEHMTQPEFVLRHRWRNGDVVIWDNRATMHYAVDDYGTTERRVRRVTIRGPRPVGPTGVGESRRRRSVDRRALTRLGPHSNTQNSLPSGSAITHQRISSSLGRNNVAPEWIRPSMVVSISLMSQWTLFFTVFRSGTWWKTQNM